MYWNSLYTAERKRGRRRRVRLVVGSPPPACLPIFCKCTPRYACQALIDDYIEWRTFVAWCNERESPTVVADPLTNIRMQRKYQWHHRPSLLEGEHEE